MKTGIFILAILIYSCNPAIDNKSVSPEKLNKSDDSTSVDPFRVDTHSIVAATLSSFDKLVLDKGNFTKDTFDIFEMSTEGGQAIVHHSANSGLLFIDTWVFGEMGKVNYQYVVSKENVTLLLSKNIVYNYDKPFYEEGYNPAMQTYYCIYNNRSLLAVLDKNRNVEPLTEENIKQMQAEADRTFNDIIGQIKILK